jgi:hypothetical protein
VFTKPDTFLVCEACWAKLPKATQDQLVELNQTEPGSPRFRHAVSEAMRVIDASP